MPGGIWSTVSRGRLFWQITQKNPSFAVPFNGGLLPNSIKVVHQILDLTVLVRIQVGQLEWTARNSHRELSIFIFVQFCGHHVDEADGFVDPGGLIIEPVKSEFFGR